MNLKFLFSFFLLTLYYNLLAVLSAPSASTVQDLERIDSTLNRTTRDLGASAVVAVLYGVGLASMSIANSNKCSATAGCFNGFCWAWCGVSLESGEWCFTTKTYSQSYKYVTCQYDSDCNECWKCAGPCTI